VQNQKLEFLLTNAEEFIGQEMALTDWVHLDQVQTNLFGEVTRWPTWMHCDAERAQRESPYGGTILHGFHMLSLLTHFLEVAGLRPGDGAYSLNYGLDKMRVLQPVLIGDGVKIRDRMSLIDVIDKGQGEKIITTANKLEVEGMEGPVLYAEYLSYWFPHKKPTNTN
jgi:acyl dehydratase